MNRILNYENDLVSGIKCAVETLGVDDSAEQRIIRKDQACVGRRWTGRGIDRLLFETLKYSDGWLLGFRCWSGGLGNQGEETYSS